MFMLIQPSKYITFCVSTCHVDDTSKILANRIANFASIGLASFFAYLYLLHMSFHHRFYNGAIQTEPGVYKYHDKDQIGYCSHRWRDQQRNNDRHNDG